MGIKHWSKITLGKILHIKHGFAFKGEYFSSNQGRYIVLTPGNFYEEGGFKHQQGKEKYYLGEIPEAYIHKKDDLIVAMTEQAEGLLGSCAIVPKDNLYLHNQRLGLITLNEEEIDKFFIYYLFKLNYIRTQIRLTSTGTKVKHTSPEKIYNVNCLLPSFEEQQKIASVLSSLDKKIELNNKINKNLEAMAKTLYDYWFVQFDFPDENGKPYKSSGGKMVYSEELKREIPKGWEILELDDIISRSGTGLNPRKNFKLGYGNNFYVTIKNINNGKIILDDKCDKIDDEALKIINNRSNLQAGDILFTSIQPIGITYLIHETPKNWNINESVFTIRPNYKKVTSEYLFMLLSSDEMKAFTKNVSSGSIHKGIRHSVLKTFKLAYSNTDLISNFTFLISSILKKIHYIDNENQKLTQLRDWLLPMLMNGQVRVE